MIECEKPRGKNVRTDITHYSTAIALMYSLDNVGFEIPVPPRLVITWRDRSVSKPCLNCGVLRRAVAKPLHSTQMQLRMELTLFFPWRFSVT